MRVTLYVLSAGCPLCEDARHHLERLAPRLGVEPRVVPVDGDPRLAVRYALRVPVLEVDGREALFGRMSLDDVASALRRAAAGPYAAPPGAAEGPVAG